MPHFIFKKQQDSDDWEFVNRFDDFEAGKKARDQYRQSEPNATVVMVAAENEMEARKPTGLGWNRTPDDV